MTQLKVQVLVVEDHADIRIMLQEALEDAGFEVLAVADGDQALSRLDGASGIRGLVTDINFGDGVDGWHVARHARERDEAIAVVYMSGGHGHDWAVLGVPKSTMVPKPFAPAQIVTALSNLMNTSDA